MQSYGLLVVGVACCISCSEDGRSGVSTLNGSPTTENNTVELDIQHRSEWRELWVEGTTNLPDGAYVDFRITHELAEMEPADQWPANNLSESGRAAVQEGQYWTKINTFNWPPGNVRVVVQFPLPPQPIEIETRYGIFGEHLEGENVTSIAGTRAVEVEYRFEHRR